MTTRSGHWHRTLYTIPIQLYRTVTSIVRHATPRHATPHQTSQLLYHPTPLLPLPCQVRGTRTRKKRKRKRVPVCTYICLSVSTIVWRVALSLVRSGQVRSWCWFHSCGVPHPSIRSASVYPQKLCSTKFEIRVRVVGGFWS
jgi:hypothetical protein